MTRPADDSLTHADLQRPFPMQDGPTIPWSTAEIIYRAYSKLYGDSQSLQRLADRGGFGWAEVAHIFNELRKRHPNTHWELCK